MMKNLLSWFYSKMADYYFYKKFLGEHTEEQKLLALEKYFKWADRKNFYLHIKRLLDYK